MLKKIQSSDQNLSLVQDNVDAALTPLQNAPLNGGSLLKNTSPTPAPGANSSLVPLTSGANNPIAHNLGHVPTAYFIGPPNVQSVIWVTSTDNKLLNVSCSVSCLAFIWVS